MTYDQFLLALALWREARGQSSAARAAIACVIRNRMEDAAHRWPKTVSGVILQPHQFSSFSAGDPNAALFPVEPAEGKQSADWMAWLTSMDIASTPMTADSTNGANAYESLPEGASRPHWADPAKITARLGPFRFYRL